MAEARLFLRRTFPSVTVQTMLISQNVQQEVHWKRVWLGTDSIIGCLIRLSVISSVYIVKLDFHQRTSTCDISSLLANCDVAFYRQRGIYDMTATKKIYFIYNVTANLELTFQQNDDFQCIDLFVRTEKHSGKHQSCSSVLGISFYSSKRTNILTGICTYLHSNTFYTCLLY